MMKISPRSCALLIAAALTSSSAFSQQPSAPTAPAVKTTVDEVVLDLVVRDKKGKPVTDLKPEELTVLDNGVKQSLKSFRLVQGSEAISATGSTKLDPLRQIRLVTLAFEGLNEADQRKTARSAAVDLIKGEQGTNVFYSVVMVNTRLLVLEPFTTDKAALIKAVDRATAGLAATKLLSESETIKGELRRNLGGDSVSNGAPLDSNVIAASVQAANAPPGNGPPTNVYRPVLARILLDMLRMDQAIATDSTRLSLGALKSLIQGLQQMPGRKSVLYFTQGMYVGSELDVMFRNLTSMANRANVTIYSVDTRGVMTFAQNSGASDQLSGAANASGTTVTRTSGAVTKDEILASDNAETSGRSNLQLAIRDLAEATGGFLIGDSNDLRSPLRHVNEEISSYYEVTFNPDITNYDGSFRKLKVDAGRKDLVVHTRNGYFALPPEARAAGLQTFEMPLLKAMSEGKMSQDVPFRSGAVLLQTKPEGTDMSVLVEVPLSGLQPKSDAAKTTLNVHCSIGALIKNTKGEVVDKITRDRSFHVTAEQLKAGNFVEKSQMTLQPGAYTLESAVMDLESGKVGVEKSEFTVAPAKKGVGISSLTSVRSYMAAVKGLDPNDPFQFQGGSITPTLNTSVARAQDSVLRLFFIIYQDASITTKPTVEIEFMQGGKSLQKAPLPLPDADAQGRIPYVMSIPASAIPPGDYQIRATAHQGDTSSASQTNVKIEAL